MEVVPAPLAAAREQLVARLTECFTRDELTVEEFERGLTIAYDAQTVDALAALTAELPRARGEVLPTVAGPLRVEAVLSNVVRAAPAAMPARLDLRSWAGNIELDLTGAAFGPGITEIVVDNILGNMDIRLPARVQVENHSSVILGSFESRQGRDSSTLPVDASVAVVRFTGRIILGNVSVRGI
jgi:hypothetical protein